jgi:hypothetical protein
MIKEYRMDTVFTFGKYKGKTLREVVKEFNLEIGPPFLGSHLNKPNIPTSSFINTYIDWCIKNLDSFYISKETLEELEKTATQANESDVIVQISEEAKQRLKEKEEILKIE